MNEIFFRKDKKGWVAYDRNGNNAHGITKDIAKNNYYILYVHNTNNEGLDLFDLSGVEKRI